MAWPGTVPALNVTDRYTESPGDASYHTETDAGPGKERPRPDKPNTRLTFSQLYNTTQVDDLLTYYFTTLNNGSATFVENHPRTGVSSTFKFAGPPTFQHVGQQKYTAAFVLELLP